MYDASVRLIEFIRALYLHIVGVSEETFIKAFMGISSPAQHLIQLNARKNQKGGLTDAAGTLLQINELSTKGEDSHSNQE
jgi:hypothetical protein